MIDNNIKKILILQTAFAGDVILTTPLIEATKKTFSDAKIHFLGIPNTINVIENNPNIDNIISYDKRGQDRGFIKILTLAKRLKTEGYDLALVPHRSLRSAFIVRLAGIPIRIGFNTSTGAFLFTTRVPYKKHIHEIERNLELLHSFGIKFEHIVPGIYPTIEDKKQVQQLLLQWQINITDKLIGIAPGSIWTTKRWSEFKFARVAEKLTAMSPQNKIVLIGGKQDHQLCHRIKNNCNLHVHNAAGLLSLRQSAELIGSCKVLLSNDSAPTHLAVAMGTPVVAIFGPTIPDFGFYPYGEGHFIIERKGLYCRPCGIHGGKKCSEKHFRCMNEISVKEVLSAVINLIQDENP